MAAFSVTGGTVPPHIQVALIKAKDESSPNPVKPTRAPWSSALIGSSWVLWLSLSLRGGAGAAGMYTLGLLSQHLRVGLAPSRAWGLQ